MSIIRNLTFKSYNGNRPLNIVSEFLDGNFEYYFSKLGHHMYGGTTRTILNWYPPVDPLPSNVHIFPKNYKLNNFIEPVDILFCHNRLDETFVQKFAMAMHVPIVAIDSLQLSNGQVPKSNRINVAAHDSLKYSTDSTVIRYGISVPTQSLEKDIDILVVGYIPKQDRDILNTIKTNFDSYLFLGDNEGYSKLEYNESYFNAFSRAKIFLNLTNNTGISYHLLHAMAAGCAVVTNKTPVLEKALGNSVEYIKSKKDTLKKIKKLLNNVKIARDLSEASLEIVKSQFQLEKFLDEWATLLNRIRNEVFIP